jgi:hypothetical protein
MKKLFYIALLSLAYVLPAKAQDAVRYGDSCYLFNPISPYDCYVENSMACYLQGGNKAGYEYVLPRKTTIFGVAATVLRDKDDTDSAGYTMYLYTLENGTDLICLDSANSFSRENRYIYSGISHGELYESTVPCYEYFFSIPHTLEGTIYIATKWADYLEVAWSWDSIHGIYFASDRNHSQRWISIDNPTQTWTVKLRDWGGLFPIIQPERVDCTTEAVAEVNVIETGDVVLTWETASDSSRLSITPYDMPVDSGLVIELTDNSYTATGLASGGALYAARLRTQCHHHCPAHADSLVWSDWGRATYFRIGNQGVLDAEPVKCSLTPNPAHGSATVQCEVEMTSVEVLTVKGERIMLRDMAGEQTCTLDLGGLAKGIYIVQVTTAQGTAARKLAVE